MTPEDFFKIKAYCRQIEAWKEKERKEKTKTCNNYYLEPGMMLQKLPLHLHKSLVLFLYFPLQLLCLKIQKEIWKIL